VAKGVGPELKPQYHTKKEKNQNIHHSYCNTNACMSLLSPKSGLFIEKLFECCNYFSLNGKWEQVGRKTGKVWVKTYQKQ
jgi:hypothetical protein